MAVRYINPSPVPERVGWGYFGDLKDEDGAPIQAADFSVLTVEIYAVDADQTEISPSTSILNTGRGTLDNLGHLAIRFTPADSALVHSSLESENHIALVQGRYSGGREFAREIEWTVINMSKR